MYNLEFNNNYKRTHMLLLVLLRLEILLPSCCLSAEFLILKNSSNPSENEEGVMLSFTGFFY